MCSLGTIWPKQTDSSTGWVVEEHLACGAGAAERDVGEAESCENWCVEGWEARLSLSMLREMVAKAEDSDIIQGPGVSRDDENCRALCKIFPTSESLFPYCVSTFSYILMGFWSLAVAQYVLCVGSLSATYGMTGGAT